MILSIEQRLNLHFLLGSLPCKTLADTRAAWELMDQLELTQEEKTSVEFHVLRNANGAAAYNWNNEKAPAAKEFELSEPQIQQLRLAIDTCPQWTPALSRRWLQPLLEQMPEPNGSGA